MTDPATTAALRKLAADRVDAALGDDAVNKIVAADDSALARAVNGMVARIEPGANLDAIEAGDDLARRMKNDPDAAKTYTNSGSENQDKAFKKLKRAFEPVWKNRAKAAADRIGWTVGTLGVLSLIGAITIGSPNTEEEVDPEMAALQQQVDILTATIADQSGVIDRQKGTIAAQSREIRTLEGQVENLPGVGGSTNFNQQAAVYQEFSPGMSTYLTVMPYKFATTQAPVALTGQNTLTHDQALIKLGQMAYVGAMQDGPIQRTAENSNWDNNVCIVVTPELLGQKGLNAYRKLRDDFMVPDFQHRSQATVMDGSVYFFVVTPVSNAAGATTYESRLIWDPTPSDMTNGDEVQIAPVHAPQPAEG